MRTNLFKKLTFALLAFLVAATVGSISAQGTMPPPEKCVFSEDFERLAGSAPTTSNTNFSLIKAAGPNYGYNCVAGLHQSSGYAVECYAQAGSITKLAKTGISDITGIGTLNFIIKKTAQVNSSSSISYILLGDGGTNVYDGTGNNGYGAASAKIAIRLHSDSSMSIRSYNGSNASWTNVASIRKDSIYNVSVVFNYSGNKIYYGDNYELENNYVDVWINGVKTTAGIGIYSLSITSFAFLTAYWTVHLDDLYIYNDVPAASVSAPPPPTVTSGTNIKNFTMTEGETLAETVTLKASNVTKNLDVSIIKGGQSAAMTVTTTNTATNGIVLNPSEFTIADDDTTFSVSIANNGELSAGTYQDTLVIEQDGIRAGEVVLNLTVSAASAPAISITKPTKDQSITADSFNTIYTLGNLNVAGTVRAQLSGAGKYDSVQIASGTGEANIWIRNLASGDYTLEAMLVETSDPSNVLATATSVDFSVNLPDIVEGTDYEVLVSGGMYREETKSYKDSVRVKIAALENIEIADVRYTTDGTTPNAASSLLTAEGIKLTAAGSHTLKYRVVIAHHDTLYGDTIVSVHYLYTDKVTANPAPGVYFSAQNVTLSCAKPDAVIRYTTDGSIPTEASKTYSEPISMGMSTTTTLKALAWADGYHTSNDSVMAGAYNIVNITPAALPVNYLATSRGDTAGLTLSNGWLWATATKASDKTYGSSVKTNLAFKEVGHYIILAFDGIPDKLSFSLGTNGNSSTATFSGVFDVDTSYDGINWGNLHSYTTISTTQTLFVESNFELSQSTKFVRWKLTAKISQNIGLGNISVTKLTCVNPTALTSNSITSEGATIGWTSTADTVKYRYGTAEPLSGEWTKAETGESSATLTLLASGTKYYYEVQNYCSNGLTSKAVIDNFTTLEALIPVITLSAESVAFDTIVTRSQTKSITVTAENLGGAAMVTLKGDSEDFSVLPATASDNSETKIDITYTATGTAEQIDTVVISGGSKTKYVTLTGTPVYPSVSVNVSSLQFNAVLGTLVKEKIVISGTNLLGDITLAKSNTSYTLDKVTVSAADAMRAGGDTVTITYAADVAASDTVVITASYATTVEIPVSGTVRNRYAVGVTFKKRCCRK